jgi:glycosyltransferase involved in cell wall biosynthesis
MFKGLKVALVHDWLTGMRGGEKCLEVFCELFPEADVFTLIHKKGSVSRTIEDKNIHTSFLQKVPGIFGRYRNFIPLFPAAIESFDLRGYDLILSSSHCVAKGVRRPEGSLHICYCHTPVRYAWKFFDEYFSEENAFKKMFIRRVMDNLKNWDRDSSGRVDHFIAISENIRKRISDYYGRSSDIIYPPVDTDSCELSETKGDHYLVVSALVPYKKVDLAVRAFAESGRPLVIVGTGSDEQKIRDMASTAPEIEFRGWVSQEELSDCYRNCSALVFPGEEDFGIVPLEAQAYGKPVIAYSAGGALETVRPLTGTPEDATGVFFAEQTTDALNRAVERYESLSEGFVPSRIRQNALKFNRRRYKEELKEYVASRWEEFRKGPAS